MVEKSPDYVFPSNFHVVKPLGLGGSHGDNIAFSIECYFFKGVSVVVLNLYHH